MGVDLTMLPLDADHSDFQFSHSMLGVERRRELWPLIEKLEQGGLSSNFQSFYGPGLNGEPGYGTTAETPYGEPIKWASAGDLAKLSTHNTITDNAKNRAVWAYLSELPADTKVALYWH